MRKLYLAGAAVLVAVAVPIGIHYANKPEPLTRAAAEAQIANTLWLVPESQTYTVIDRICATFEDGWGPAYVDNSVFLIPPHLEQDFAHVMMLAARAECPEHVEAVEHYHETNGWELR